MVPEETGDTTSKPQTQNTIGPDNLESSTVPALHKSSNTTKIIVIIFSILTGLLLLGSLGWNILVNGGPQGFTNSHKSAPNPKDASFIADRNRGIDTVDKALKALNKNGEFTEYATSTSDRCTKGESNLLQQSSYAYSCVYKETKFYGFNNDFRQQMLDFEQQLLSIGWTTNTSDTDPDHSIKKSITEYYDDPQLQSQYGKQNMVLYTPSPSPYQIDGQKAFLGKTLWITYTQRGVKSTDLSMKDISRAQASSLGISSYPGLVNDERLQNVNEIVNKIIASDTYVLVLSVENNYLEY